MPSAEVSSLARFALNARGGVRALVGAFCAFDVACEGLGTGALADLFSLAIWSTGASTSEVAWSGPVCGVSAADTVPDFTLFATVTRSRPARPSIPPRSNANAIAITLGRDMQSRVEALAFLITE